MPVIKFKMDNLKLFVEYFLFQENEKKVKESKVLRNLQKHVQIS